MNPSATPEIRTRMFARAFGPFFTIVPAIITVRATSQMPVLLHEFAADPLWQWALGAALLLWGSVIIAFHQYWRSPAAIIVSVVGWFFAIRGVLLLTVPRAYDAAGNAVYSSGASAVIWVLFICLASTGLYLTYVGWKPEPGADRKSTRLNSSHRR